MQELHIIVKNQPGMLKTVTEVLFGANVNIEYLHVEPSSNGADGEIVIKSNSDLSAVSESLKAVDGVIELK